MSGSFYNSQELDTNLAFPILSWNSPDPDPIRVMKSNTNTKIPNQNITNMDSYVAPMQSMASQPASYSMPFQFSYPDIIPSTSSSNIDSNSVLSYNYYANNYGKTN